MSRATGEAETQGPRRLVPVSATSSERAAIAANDVAWAARQGTNDRAAGTECPKYKHFLSRYRLPCSPRSLRMWNAYILARQPPPAYAPRTGGKRARPDEPDPRRNSIPAVVSPAWAAGQARQDIISGNLCRSYEDFMRAYGLRKSDAARRVWSAYQEGAKLAPRRTPPKTAQKSHPGRGLTLGDPPARRRTVRRYDRTEPRKSDLSPQNAAMLMKINQQNTLVDIWR
jgi:hypothetical protein